MPTYTGTNDAETLTGSSGDDLIDGMRGNDHLFGLDGADVFTYRLGRSFYISQDSDGADVIDGGLGTDLFSVIGSENEGYFSRSSNYAPQTLSLTADAGGDALFASAQSLSTNSGPGTVTNTVTLRNVETAAFAFTDLPPSPINSPTGSFGTAYTTVDRITIGDLSATALTGVINLYLGHGADVLNASSAVNVILAQGAAGNDELRGGSGADTLDGGSDNDLISGGAGANVIIGGSGVDTLDYSTATGDVTVDLNEGRAVNNGYGAQDLISGIENLVGSAYNDILIGEGGANVLTGGEGADYLIGLGGNDQLIGGAGAANTLQGGVGDDSYLVSAVGDSLIEFADEGLDRVFTSLSTLTLRDNFEELYYTGSGSFTGYGNADANLITGGSQIDNLYGGGGDDTLNGGSWGADHLYGGAGNDRLVGMALAGATANYSLAAGGVYANLASGLASNDGDGGVDTFVNIERLVGSNFADVLIGNGLANVLNGGLGRDVLVGGAGDDLLMAGSGAANELYGGTGDDRFRLFAIGDTVIENAGEGYDTVESWVQSTYTLRNNFEALVFKGAGDFHGTGNTLNNAITGGAGNDVLAGLDGADVLSGLAGNDILDGGVGDDRLFGGDGEDLLRGGAGDDFLTGEGGRNVMIGGLGNDIMQGDGGTPTDFATVDYSGAGSAVTARVNGQGNDGDGGTDTLSNIDAVIGSAFNDLLIGDGNANTFLGGAGADTLLGFGGDDTLIGGAGAANTLQGGTGNDVYVVTAVGDSVIEMDNEGIDRVETNLSAHTLRANVENLTYTGTTAFSGVGNALNNIIIGGVAGDTLSSLGGNDWIDGGGGTDIFVMRGVQSEYSIQFNGDNFIITDNVAGRDGVDTVFHVERIQFGDGSVLTLPAPAAPAAAEAELPRSYEKLHDGPLVPVDAGDWLLL